MHFGLTCPLPPALGNVMIKRSQVVKSYFSVNSCILKSRFRFWSLDSRNESIFAKRLMIEFRLNPQGNLWNVERNSKFFLWFKI